MATEVDRLIRKEVSLGAIREKEPPQNHIGIAQIAPFLPVGSDDVIFSYIAGGFQDGLAPQRAEDAEAELAQKDELLYGEGRAAVVDWSLKDKYTPSDVSRYREDLFLQELAKGATSGQLPLNYTGRQVEDFNKRLAREDARRRRFLDNRLEWLIMQAIQWGKITYDDGKIKWVVDYERPANQTDQAPASGMYTGTDFDPIGDFEGVLEGMEDEYGVRPKRVIASKKLLKSFWNSDRFMAKMGIVVGGTPSAPIDMRYVNPGFDRDAAVRAIEDSCDIKFIRYDSVYRTRGIGSNVWVNQRFLRDDTFYFLPSESVDNTGDLGEIDETEIGFAKMLTSPHPEGNWSSGYYEWEKESTDPWFHARGSGIKAFPVFPYMEYTYTMKAL